MPKKIKGFYPFKKMTISAYLENLENMGLQASQVFRAVEILKQMKKDKATIFLTFTSNMVSSGLRDIFTLLCRQKKVDVIITSIGSIEEDIMKALCDFELCNFEENDVALFEKGKNRVGNIIIPNSCYIKLEKFLQPFFKSQLEKQKKLSKPIIPSELLKDLGLYLNDPSSFIYWCAKNNIPIFCPALTDGAFGLQLHFFKQASKNRDFLIDASGDLKPLSEIILNSSKTAGIILGGGVAKHHAIGANILREGFDYAIYISTAVPYDGSLSGAQASEAKSWGKINKKATVANIYCEASIIFPLLASQLLD
ncbi:MAG: deoxyhypusine synthase family protein [Candidatus Anstonellaceae archaeon]